MVAGREANAMEHLGLACRQQNSLSKQERSYCDSSRFASVGIFSRLPCIRFVEIRLFRSTCISNPPSKGRKGHRHVIESPRRGSFWTNHVCSISRIGISLYRGEWKPSLWRILQESESHGMEYATYVQVRKGTKKWKSQSQASFRNLSRWKVSIHARSREGSLWIPESRILWYPGISSFPCIETNAWRQTRDELSGTDPWSKGRVSVGIS